MNLFSILLCITIILRGIGAGIILSTGILVNPMRSKMGLVSYTNFVKVFYKRYGLKIYAAITIIGSCLTVLLLIMAYKLEVTLAVRWLLIGAAGFTFIGFTGTGVAYPTMQKLWKTNEEDTALLTALLNRFEFWGWVSATAHLLAFSILASCLFALQLK